ncbi:MAG: hypothetical protein R3F20_13555 [Planctomycetota bacterium]
MSGFDVTRAGAASALPVVENPRRESGADAMRMLNTIGRGAASFFAPGATGLVSALSGMLGSGGGAGDFGELQRLLDRQIQSQAQMQTFTAATNIEKTKHDTRMSAIQNMRA